MSKLVYLILITMVLLTLSSCKETPSDEGGADEPHVCEFNVKSPKSKYIKYRSTCTQLAEFYYSCSCGEMGTETFSYGDYAGHDYKKVVDEKYLLVEATVKTSAIYNKSCSKCGFVGEETFIHGSAIALTEEEKGYVPTSVTVTLYDTLESVYGFTYNTYKSPVDPVIQIKRAGAYEWEEIAPTSYEAVTMDADDNQIAYYISKAQLALEPGVAYVYRPREKR